MGPRHFPAEGVLVARASRENASEPAESGGTLQAVERALRLLGCLADSPRPRTLQELAQVMSCSTSTVHRLMQTLSLYNLAERDPLTGRYRLGVGVFPLSDARARQVDLHLLARPYLDDLSDEYLETVSLWIRRGETDLCLAASESRQEIRYFVEVGQVAPLTDLGAKSKVLLAGMPREEADAVLAQVSWPLFSTTPAQVRDELAEVARTGIARISGGVHRDMSAIAAALRDHHGRIVGALAIAGPSTRWTAAAMDAAEEGLLSAAAAISGHLGGKVAGMYDEVATRRSSA